MYRTFDDEVFQDIEAVIRNTMRTQSLWDEAHEEDGFEDDRDVMIAPEVRM